MGCGLEIATWTGRPGSQRTTLLCCRVKQLTAKTARGACRLDLAHTKTQAPLSRRPRPPAARSGAPAHPAVQAGAGQLRGP